MYPHKQEQEGKKTLAVLPAFELFIYFTNLLQLQNNFWCKAKAKSLKAYVI